jgi:hypothetical protein
LRAEQSVTLDYQPAQQDGFSFRATEVWPAGQEPARAKRETSGASNASTLTITLDDLASNEKATSSVSVYVKDGLKDLGRFRRRSRTTRGFRGSRDLSGEVVARGRSAPLVA